VLHDQSTSSGIADIPGCSKPVKNKVVPANKLTLKKLQETCIIKSDSSEALGTLGLEKV